MEKHSYLMMVDSNNATLEMLKKCLDAEFGSGQSDELLRLVSENTPNLVLMDITLPDLGIAGSREILRNHAGMPVIRVSARYEIDTLSNALDLVMKSNSANKTLENFEVMTKLLPGFEEAARHRINEN